MINNGERYIDLEKIIKYFKKINPKIIEIIGYNPFYDTPEEYNLQYSQDYVKKIIAILRMIFPKTKIKIKYATNGNNDLKNYTNIGVNIISGVYTNNTSKMYNLDNIKEYL